MFADDISCICPSVKGLQNLFKFCEEYAFTHNIVFNPSKSCAFVFTNRQCSVNVKPILKLNETDINFSLSTKYLGVIIGNNLSDDHDIFKQMISTYCIAKNVKASFKLCSTSVKKTIFHAYCTIRFASHLW